MLFPTTLVGSYLPHDVAFAKLASMVAAAKLLRAEFG